MGTILVICGQQKLFRMWCNNQAPERAACAMWVSRREQLLGISGLEISIVYLHSADPSLVHAARVQFGVEPQYEAVSG